MNNKKKILIFSDWFLPGYKAGGPVRSVANLIEHLSDFFDFFIITRNVDFLENKPYDNVAPDVWLDFSNKASVFYISSENLNFKFLKNLIKSIDYDIAYINGVYSFYFSILPVFLAKKEKKKIIVAPRGMLSKQAFSRKIIKKSIFIFLTKVLNFYKNVVFHSTSSDETIDINGLFKQNTYYQIPNLPRKIKSICLKSINKTIGCLKLVSIARISQEKNTKFALEVLSELTQGEIEFTIYGSVYDAYYWNECEKIILQLPSNIKVLKNDPIATDIVIDTFADYHFSFMPSIAENFGHSILESLLAGTPVITSDATPWRNLVSENIGWDLPLQNKTQFVQTLQNCLNMSQNQYNEISANAFNYAQIFLKNTDNLKDYQKMFENE